VKNEAHTGGHQSVLMPTADAARSSLEAARPSPQVPAAPVAEVIETLSERYGALKRNVHDYLVTLPKDSPCWDNSFLPTLAEQVGLTNED
jgi:hypothetical protein